MTDLIDSVMGSGDPKSSTDYPSLTQAQKLVREFERISFGEGTGIEKHEAMVKLAEEYLESMKPSVFYRPMPPNTEGA